MTISFLRGEDYLTSEWSGGTSSEIYISPKGAKLRNRDFDFRISTASCDLEESNFTIYEDYNRYLTVLDGNLDFNCEDYRKWLMPYEIHFFGGEQLVNCFGKVRDFNLIIKKELIGELKAVSLTDESIDIEVDTKFFLIFNNEHQLKIKIKGRHYELNKMEALVLEDENSIIKIKGKNQDKFLIAKVY